MAFMAEVRFLLFSLQPFKFLPRKRVVIFLIAFSWIASLAIALIPALEQHDHVFYQKAVFRSKTHMYFKNIDITFDNLKLFVNKLHDSYPALINTTMDEKMMINESKSWITLFNILQTKFASDFKPEGYFG